MKKALAFALALTMAATMMAGCGKKEKRLRRLQRQPQRRE